MKKKNTLCYELLVVEISKKKTKNKKQNKNNETAQLFRLEEVSILIATIVYLFK